MTGTKDIVARIESLELAARQVVEGYLAGRHRSPRFGFAVEFAQHREYSPGDDIKHIDWKVYGRTERHYLKQYEQETNLIAWLIVDASGSMNYTSGERTKYEAAAALAAGFAHLIVRQTDSVGLAVLADGVRGLLKPSAASKQVKEIMRTLAEEPADPPGTFGRTLHDLAGRLGRRGIVFLFSDFLDDVPQLLEAIRRLRFQKHEVVLFHVMDPAELDFPFRHPTEFRGLEAMGRLPTDPLAVRESYLAALRSHLTELESGCRTLETDYVLIRSDGDLGSDLAAYLRKRLES